jgi:ABC-type nitrate/sulfonate/bicarbonate transport system substrate-binding protein
VERGKILKGKRIGGAYVGTLPDIILKVVAKDAGLAPNEFVGSPMAPTEMLAAFANGSVDGFVSNPPYVDQVLIDGTGALVSDTRKHEPEEFSPSSGSLLLARADFCAKSRSVCEKMVHGLYEAVRTIRNDSNTSLAVMKTGFGTYTEKVRESAYETLKSITPDNPITSAEALENGDKMNVAAGFMRPEDMLADYKALINNEFVK